MKHEFRGDRVGRGPWRRDWYSICSKHRVSSRECRLCMTGYYVNRWRGKVGRIIHDHAYPIWFWWVNRSNSRSRRFLEGVFPRLKKK